MIKNFRKARVSNFEIIVVITCLRDLCNGSSAKADAKKATKSFIFGSGLLESTKPVL